MILEKQRKIVQKNIFTRLRQIVLRSCRKSTSKDMASISHFQLGFYFILLNFLSCCVASPLTLEQRVQQLEQNNVDIKAQVSRLEEKVESQEMQLNNLTEQLAAAKEELILSKNVESSDDHRNQRTIYRTCHEARAADSTLKSGMHWIDPDGKAVGDDPIRVHCNMTTGMTSILHNSESETDVGRCAKRGCYSKEIEYDVTSTRQIAALIELSAECHQSIKYDCVNAPLNFNGVPFSWWNDRNGIPRYFWSGKNSSAQQSVCQCGIDGNCFDDFLPCNCDSVLPTQLSDIGIITNKTILPITRLNFGRIVQASSSGAHTLGRFECSGQVAIIGSTNGIPKSCTDLWWIGHSKSGLYSVMGANKQVESMYCDFTKLPADSGFQTKIALNANSSPVYFYVQRSNSFSTRNVPIPFDLEIINVGGAMKSASGIFTAPRAGNYFFSFSGISDGSYSITVGLYVNNNRIGAGRSGSSHQTFNIQSMLRLNARDKVSVQIWDGNSALYDTGSHYTHFSGWLLHEDISSLAKKSDYEIEIENLRNSHISDISNSDY